MLIQEHAQTAQEFLEVADHEFMAGDNLQACEKLWGAASHAMMAVAQQRGWRYNRHRDLAKGSEMLAEEMGDASIADRFAIAEKLHANFYHDFMEDHEFDYARERVRAFIERVLALVD